jgi:predicted dehydrogenase
MLSRREFLAQAGASGLAARLPDSSGPAGARRAPRPPRLNLACIGVGGRGAALVAYATRENLVALCDVDQGRLEQAALKAPAARKYADFREMLERERDLHGVLVATPDHAHAAASVLAMKRGLDVFCEKPLARSVFEARLMARLAARSGLVTQMGIQGHAAESLRRGVEIVRSGAIGSVKEVHAWSNRPIWPADLARPAGELPVPPQLSWDLWLGPAPERPYHSAYHPFKWRSWWDFGTGAIGDMGAHALSAVAWALDLDAPSTVEAEGPPPNPDSVPSWMIARYEFPSRGSRGPVRLVWYDGRKLPPEELFHGEKIAQSGALLVGEKGSLYFTNDYGSQHVLLPRARFADHKPPEPFLPRSPGVFEEWASCCKAGRKTSASFEFSGPLTEILLLANVAFRSRRRIEWDPAALRAPNAPEADPFIRPAFRKGWSL